MKIILSMLLFLFFITCSSLLYAAIGTRTLTINWTMTDTTNVQGYKVYYDENSSMADKVWINDCNSPIEDPIYNFTIICNNVEIVSGQNYYFTIAAQMNDGSEIFSDTVKEKYINSVKNLNIVVR